MMKTLYHTVASRMLAAVTATGLLLTLITACSDDELGAPYIDNNTYYDEAYRPAVHFTPKTYWVNDPNGMVYFEGEYHLFYQYNPMGSVWGNMSWGHAVTKDLMHWEHLPVALTKDANGEIFSGSIVIDENNTAGFGKDAMVAVYTSNGQKQSQSLAYSLDKGRTFVKYANNPVLKEETKPDFRDPKVFWSSSNNQWMMSLATGQTITFYSSSDLKAWEKLSEFGEGIGAHGGVWECPDLIQMDDNGQKKWILLVSINPGGPNGGSATQYFVGDFDGTTFTADPLPYPLWVDFGKDNYAGVTWNNVPEGRHLFIAWMSNWQYAGAVPTMTWRGGMTLPRELALQKSAEGAPLLTSKVVKEVDGIAGEWKTISASGGNYTLDNNGEAYELQVEMEITDVQNLTLVLANEKGDKYPLTLNRADRSFVIDRTASGDVSFSPEFGKVLHAPLNLSSNHVTLTLFVDRSSVEALVNDGWVQQTNLVYPSEVYSKLSVDADKGGLIKSVKRRILSSVW